MALRVRAWLIACATLIILLVPIAVAGTAWAKSDRGAGALIADGQTASAASPPEVQQLTLTVARQAYDLLLDNFVSPPQPSVLLLAAASEIGRRTADKRTAEWPVPTISADASRDDAWRAFELWLDRVALALSPIVERTALDEMVVRALAQSMAEHHTRYLDPRQNEEHQAWRRGEVRYDGIGARLRRPSTVVLEVFEGSPAARAGVRRGDRIIGVNGESIADATSDVAITKIRGPIGSTVELLVERRGAATPLRFTIERGEISMPFVRWSVMERDDGRRVGYLQIRGFPEPGIDERVGQALTELDARKIDGLLLDLRGNSGGRIDVGVKVASRFIQDGTVFQQVDRSGRQRQVRPVEGVYWGRSIPIVALIDGGTASMGEILGSALQETGTAKVVGTVSSGSVAGARMFPLANGGAMQITVLTITSGRGTVLNDIGVQPDQAIDLSDDDLLSGVDAQLEAGIQQLGLAPRSTSLRHLISGTAQESLLEAA
ncbi:MAG: S41 family peptidase [Chloroflexota bacterium]